ncbi:hypothetical protein ACXYMU_00695 [Pontibacter sp. CAU 1760]
MIDYQAEVRLVIRRNHNQNPAFRRNAGGEVPTPKLDGGRYMRNFG